MRYLRLAALALFFVAQGALAGTPGFPNHYVENGDAGDKFAPQDVTGGPWLGIVGGIGSSADPVDAFRFGFAGGTFGGSFVSTVSVFTTLWTGTGTPSLIAPVPPPPDVGFTPTWILTQGIYIVQFSTSDTDPPFTFTTSGPPLFGPAAIPEPGTWALMLIGLTGIVLMRTRAMRATELPFIRA